MSSTIAAPRKKSLFVLPDGSSVLFTFILVSSLFLLWGVCNGLIDVMDKHFQDELGLTKSQSAWVQFAHYLGYFLMSIPAGWLATRLGYKRGIIAGLLIVAAGGLWFIPATRINALARLGTVSPTTAIFTGMTVTVDATPSGAGITGYDWDWGDGPPAGSGVVSSHVYNTAGRYQIVLRITGGQYDGQVVTQSIPVLLNNTPTASFTPNPANGPAPLAVAVNGSSTDPGGTGADQAQGDYIKSFSWNWGDGTPGGQGEKTTHLYSSPGTYTITLTATDIGGLFGTATRQVTVTKQYVCSPVCTDASSSSYDPTKLICGPDNAGTANQCYQCLSNTDCGSGYRCLGTPCQEGSLCSDGVTECPADGRCPEATSCKVGTVCPDGAACPADGI